MHHRTCLGFTDHGELLRVDVDDLHVSWFEAAVLGFEPVRGPYSSSSGSPARSPPPPPSSSTASPTPVSNASRGDFLGFVQISTTKLARPNCLLLSRRSTESRRRFFAPSPSSPL
jgi:hypothetical protein